MEGQKMSTRPGAEPKGNGPRKRSLRGLPAALALLVLISSWSSVAQAQPGNDAFASPTVISALPFTDGLSTSTATTESGEPGPCGRIANTLWYRFTPSSNVLIQADTFGSGYDTVVAVYTGTSLDYLITVACNDDFGGGRQSYIEFRSTAGVTYLFQVGGFAGSTGDLTFHMDGTAILPPPSNDDFALAAAIRSLPFTNDVNTLEASSEPSEPSPCGDIANTVWYTFTPPSEFRIQADTVGSNYDTVLAVYTGTSLVDLINVDCNDDFPGGPLQSFIEFRATAGVTYLFQVGGFRGSKGDLTFHVTTPDGDLAPPTITCPAGVIQYSSVSPLTFVDIGTATASDNSGTVTVTNNAPTDHLFPVGTTSVTWTATDLAGNVASCTQSVFLTDLPRSAVTNSRLCGFDADPDLLGQQFHLSFKRERHHDRDDDRDDRHEGRDEDDNERDREGGREARMFRLRSSDPRGFFYNVFFFGTPGSSVTLDINIPYPFVTRGREPIRVHDGARIESGCFVPSDPISGFTISGTGSVTASGALRVRLRDFACQTPPTPVSSCRSVTVTVSGTVPSSGLVYVTLHLDYGLKGKSGFGRNAENDAIDRWTRIALIPNLGSYTFGVFGGMEDTQTIQNKNVFKSPTRDDD